MTPKMPKWLAQAKVAAEEARPVVQQQQQIQPEKDE
jgi:hypothetical protein